MPNAFTFLGPGILYVRNREEAYSGIRVSKTTAWPFFFSFQWFFQIFIQEYLEN